MTAARTDKLSLITVTEGARSSGIERKLFRQAVLAGEIPVIRVAGRPRIEKRALEAYVRRQLEQSRVLVNA